MPNQKQTNLKEPGEMTEEELLEEEARLGREIAEQEKLLNKEVGERLAGDPELKSAWEGLEEQETRDTIQETGDRRQEAGDVSLNKNEHIGIRTIKRMPAVSQAPRAPTIERKSVVQEKKNEPRLELKAPVKPDAASTFSENTKREIEELRKKLQTLERRDEYTKPPIQTPRTVERRSESSPVLKSALPEPEKRYGVEPAKDLGIGDFDWHGNIGGVEIEKSVEESEEKEELEKAKILEEIEHPPSYAETTAFEKSLGKSEETTATEPNEEKSKPEAEPDKEELEKIRQIRYGGGDPYREPVE